MIFVPFYPKTYSISIVNSVLLCYDKNLKGGTAMAFSYKPLWKLLIDRDMTKKQLMNATSVSKSTMDKMARSKYVSMDVLDRICSYLDCNIESVIEHLPEQ